MSQINGVVMAGGNSSRMGLDKSFIQYNGQAQYLHVQKLLSAFCNEVYYSTKTDKFKSEKTILDSPELGDIGPISGIVTCLEKLQSPVFILGVDYPLIQAEDIEQIYNLHSENFMASVFYNPQSGFLEPLIGIYEPAVLPFLKDAIKSGNTSIQNILSNASTQKIIPLNIQRIKSFDLPEDAHKLMEGNHES